MDLYKLTRFYEAHVNAGVADLRRFLEAGNISCGDSCVASLRLGLQEQLFRITYKVLLAHYKLIASENSFDDYCDALAEDDVRSFFYARYPAMKQWMDVIARNWTEQAGLILARFEADRAQIAAVIVADALTAEVRTVKLGAGDTHRGGRTVAEIELTTGAKLFYKPRSLAIDNHFSDLVDWLNERAGTDLRTPVALDRGTHGWARYIAQADCDTAEEVADYYRRLGCWLALLYALEGTDFHYENIIAAGAHPIPVDLESFFHPAIPLMGNENVDNQDTSVLKVGLLPHQVLLGGIMPDISGIADVEGAAGLLDSLALVRDEHGNVNFQRSKGKLRGGKNVPRLGGNKVEMSSQVVASLQAGFASMYQTLLADRDALRERLQVFRNDEIRVLFRDTVTYGHLLEESTHPTLMADPGQLVKHFELLWVAVPEYEAAGKFVRFEIDDLWRRDVPLFSARVDGKDLSYADDGVIPGFFERSGFDSVMEKLNRLSAQDLRDQTWIIGKSLELRDVLIHARAPDPAARASGDYGTPERMRQRALDEALRVGDYIEQQIYVDGDYATWVVLKTASLDSKTVEVVPAFYDLYFGMCGEILFLTYLAKLSGQSKYAVLAEKSLSTMLLKLDTRKDEVRALGLIVGWGSVIYTLTSLGVLSGDARHFDKVEAYLEAVDLPAYIAADKSYSLIKGAAGLMLACAEYHLATGSPRALRLAEQAAQHLLSRVQPDLPGFSWRINSAVPLSGMAHGASGIGLAFARLYEATGNETYRAACDKALEYERSLFIAQQQNWKDCRDLAIKHADGNDVCAMAWAHGAPGIGMVRADLLGTGWDDGRIRQDLDVAVKTTLAQGFERTHELINGSFGNADLLLSSDRHNTAALKQASADALARLFADIDRRGWNLGEKNYHALGMMNGVTGIGYQCLRIAFPERVPSMLTGRTGRGARHIQ